MSPIIRASATTTINRDIHEVFAFIADGSTMDEWVTGVSGTVLVSGDGSSEGDVYEYDYTYGGRTAPMRVEVTSLTKPTHVSMTALDGPFPFHSDLTLEALSEGTRVTNTIEPGADGRVTTVMFTLFRPVLRWLMRRQLRAELAELKQILEDKRSLERATSPRNPAAPRSR